MKLLYLVHRMPYPPNKGDKVPSYHLLRHLADRHDVFLGTFIDDPEDEAHVDTVKAWCRDAHFVRLNPRRARWASLRGLLTGEPLGLPYYRDAGLRDWVRRTVAAQRIDGILVFSSTMAQYAEGLGLPTWVDFVDLDSAKWTAYAQQHRWPLSWLYAREGRQLLRYERQVAAWARASFFVTEAECRLFREAAPEVAPRVHALCNGVDAEFFSPQPERGSPYPADVTPVVFTGAMDYWPNVDAVTWFVQDMLPRLKANWPQLRFYIVGRSPTPAVKALAGPDVEVTGTVPDVRPYLQHAAVVVAPLRLARGIQNKVLEAMAMARPVVAASHCVQAIDGCQAGEVTAADTVDEYLQAVEAWLAHPAAAEAVGQAARCRVLDGFAWPARLAPLDRALAAP
ncbi:TIGR03087 family PEP-CTERM/XrtA system glycosyltransferase [Inhella crocodyli]|uniref:TIGR03087 family PEP-CTERM/XrtA system glycosyltransferase n=1 Tax=Inhella crocodyli TaxID=2499851 RepID=A0A3S2UXY3_9BURK|nr:TIGR03087 family PEP-CTERM/XrtA system glycosyltransferase [Inhella crocodyli]RVT87739.1 TIGR03087 family PEP-CTERM/XrtA system glycosyltransferase [Inhella crocodyli]